MEMTQEQRDIITHSLGLDHPSFDRRRRPYRRHYCTKDGTPELEALVTAGLMEHGGLINEGRDRYYLVTLAGAKAVGAKRPAD